MGPQGDDKDYELFCIKVLFIYIYMHIICGYWSREKALSTVKNLPWVHLHIPRKKNKKRLLNFHFISFTYKYLVNIKKQQNKSQCINDI